MTITPEELRVLAAGDRGITRRWRPSDRHMQTRQPRGVGSLTYEEALRYHSMGYGRRALADVAGVTPYTIGVWRNLHGLSRRKIR